MRELHPDEIRELRTLTDRYLFDLTRGPDESFQRGQAIGLLSIVIQDYVVRRANGCHVMQAANVESCPACRWHGLALEFGYNRLEVPEPPHPLESIRAEPETLEDLLAPFDKLLHAKVVE